ncbi:MAG: MFS transporter [Chromatocurvus sp.]
MSAYLGFALRNRHLLAFGAFTAVLSGFGQTFYIGLFNTEFRQDFGLSHGELGLAYGAATLTAGLVLGHLGRLYDRIDLRLFLTAAACILASGCGLLAGAQGLMGLVAALFMLRLGGQGLMSHIAMTTTARHFHEGRGKALSIAGLGFPIAEALFPAAAVGFLTVLSWRALWAGSAAVVLLGFLPLLWWLLGRPHGPDTQAQSNQSPAADRTLGEVRRDWRFALLVPATLVAPFVATVVFFHQIPLAHAKGWSTELVAWGLGAFAFGHIAGLLGGGLLVDRWAASRVFVPALLPILLSMGVLALIDAPWASLAWPGLLGLGLGASVTAVSALLAELYGVTHLGAIRGLLHALMVVSTAIGPPLFGWLLDQGLATEAIAVILAIGIAAAALSSGIALRDYTKAVAGT